MSGTTSYTWNARNQLTSISGAAGSASFRYDAQGRRIEKTVNGVSTGFLYDGAQAIAELKGGSLDTVYHTGLEIDEVLARYAPLGNKTLLTDALMSVVAQANDDETVSNFYAYSPYGETQALGNDDGNAIQYTGRENDGTGLYYYRARYYDPGLKRFISEDPIGIAAGLNLYAYVGGDPVSFADPRGLDKQGDAPPTQGGSSSSSAPSNECTCTTLVDLPIDTARPSNCGYSCAWLAGRLTITTCNIVHHRGRCACTTTIGIQG